MDGARPREEERESFARFMTADEGQDLVEYGLLAALVSIFAMGSVTLLGQQIGQVMWQTIAANF